MVSGRVLAIDGIPLDVEFRAPAPGSPSAPTLVFLHEGLGCIELWRSFPADLARAAGGLPTLVYSRGGYGHSDPVTLPRPVSYMHDEADRVLPRVLDHFRIDRCVLVGHSDGASIALLVAGGDQIASRVAGLVLLAPHVFVEDASVTAITAARDAYVESERTDGGRSAGLRDRLARYHHDVDNAFWGWNDVWLSPEFRAWDITDRLANITCPVAVIQGRDDPYGTLAQVDAIVAGVRGRVEAIVFDGVGHAPHLESPDATVVVAASLIGQLPAAAGHR